MMPHTQRTLDAMSTEARGMLLALATMVDSALRADPLRRSHTPEAVQLKEFLDDLGDAVLRIDDKVTLPDKPDIFTLISVSKDGSCSIRSESGGGLITTLDRLTKAVCVWTKQPSRSRP